MHVVGLVGLEWLDADPALVGSEIATSWHDLSFAPAQFNVNIGISMTSGT